MDFFKRLFSCHFLGPMNFCVTAMIFVWQSFNNFLDDYFDHFGWFLMIFFMTFFVTFQCHCNDFLGKVGTNFCMNDFYDNFLMIFLTIFSCLFLGTMTHCNEFFDGYLDHFLMSFWLLFYHFMMILLTNFRWFIDHF